MKRSVANADIPQRAKRFLLKRYSTPIQIVDQTKESEDDENYWTMNEQCPPECQVLRDGLDNSPKHEGISNSEDLDDEQTSDDYLDSERGK